MKKYCFLFLLFVAIHFLMIFLFSKRIISLRPNNSDLSFYNSYFKIDDIENIKYIRMSTNSYFGKNTLMPLYTGVLYSVKFKARLGKTSTNPCNINLTRGGELLSSILIDSNSWKQYEKSFFVKKHLIRGDNYFKMSMTSQEGYVDIRDVFISMPINIPQ